MTIIAPGPAWRRRATTAALWLLAVLLTASVIPGRSVEAAFPGQNGSIAFERFGDVYLSAPDGSLRATIDIAGV